MPNWLIRHFCHIILKAYFFIGAVAGALAGTGAEAGAGADAGALGSVFVAAFSAFILLKPSEVPESSINLETKEIITMAEAKPHVNCSKRSPVFLTPNIWPELPPPNSLDSPPPLGFWIKTMTINKTAITIAIIIIVVNIF
jgi:hypothetical protein